MYILVRCLILQISIIYVNKFVQVIRLFKTEILRKVAHVTCAHLLDGYASRAFNRFR